MEYQLLLRHPVSAFDSTGAMHDNGEDVLLECGAVTRRLSRHRRPLAKRFRARLMAFMADPTPAIIHCNRKKCAQHKDIAAAVDAAPDHPFTILAAEYLSFHSPPERFDTAGS